MKVAGQRSRPLARHVRLSGTRRAKQRWASSGLRRFAHSPALGLFYITGVSHGCPSFSPSPPASSSRFSLLPLPCTSTPLRSFAATVVPLSPPPCVLDLSSIVDSSHHQYMQRVDPPYPTFTLAMSAPGLSIIDSSRLPTYRSTHVGRFHPYPMAMRRRDREEALMVRLLFLTMSLAHQIHEELSCVDYGRLQVGVGADYGGA